MQAPTQIDRVTLTKQQLRATEIMLYRMADLINRLLADNGVQYTKALSAAAFDDIEVTSKVTLRPGTYNRIPLVAWVQGTVAAQVTITLYSIAINQASTTP